MKKIFFVLLAISLISFSLIAGKPADQIREQKGSIKFEAYRMTSGEYQLTLYVNQSKPVIYPIKAVKVTYEPSCTVVFLLTDGTLAPADRDFFLAGERPETRAEMTEMDEKGNKLPMSSLVESQVVAKIAHPTKIANDRSVIIEFLVEKEGKLQTHLVSKTNMKDNSNFGMQSYYSIK